VQEGKCGTSTTKHLLAKHYGNRKHAYETAIMVLEIQAHIYLMSPTGIAYVIYLL